MVCIPKKEKKTERLSFSCILSGILSMGISSIFDYRVIFQIISVALIVAGIQLLVRFVLSDYRYLIDDRDDGTAELFVYRKQGKRDVLVCRMSLSAVVEMFAFGTKKAEVKARYNYTQNFGAVGYSLIFDDGDKCVEVIIEPDAEFINAINARIGIGEGDFGFMM